MASRVFKTIAILLLASLAWSEAQAKIYITITDARVQKGKLALGRVHALPGTTPNQEIADKLAEQVRADLEFVNLFDFLDPQLYANLDTQDLLYKADYEAWGLTGATFLLKMGYKLEGSKLTLEAFLHDIPGHDKIISTRYSYDPTQYPRLVHALSEDILNVITGESGLFKSRVIMVCREMGKKGTTAKDIFIVDPDGRNLKQLTRDRTLSLSPAWSPAGNLVSYTQYEIRNSIEGKKKIRKTMPVLKTHNLITGARKVISERSGMNSGAAWAPGGDKIALTLSYTGRPEIYLVPPDGSGSPDPLSRAMKVRRLSGEGFQPSYESLLFDVEPAWSPDGKQMVFSSARTGSPMIYVADVGTRIAQQLTFAGKYNASPSWSPKGNKILFSAQHHADGNFDLYLIDPDGNNLSRLTAGGRIGRRKINYENGSWAATGRHFAYASNESGNYQIFVRTLEGEVKRRISPPDMECTSPAWGPKE